MRLLAVQLGAEVQDMLEDELARASARVGDVAATYGVRALEL
jgi:hypothetical protein